MAFRRHWWSKLLLSRALIAQPRPRLAPRICFLALISLLVLSLTPNSVWASNKGKKRTPAQRTVWTGLARGPASPAQAARIERSFVEVMGTYAHLNLVDVAGGALNDRSLARDASGLAKLIDKGIDLLLNLDTKSATEKLELAIQLFEAKLTPLRDHELLHDAMLARAEAQVAMGQRETAKTSLQRLAALKPRETPNKQTHPKKFVRLWKAAIKELGHTGTIEIRTQPPNALIQVDGRPLGASPITTKPLHPGRHYIVARWPSFTVTKTVQLSPGQNLFAELQPSGPAYRIKTDLIAALSQRDGANRIGAMAKKVLRISEGKQLICARLRQRGDDKFLLVARFDRQGKIITLGSSKVKDFERIRDVISKVVAAVVDVKHTGEFSIDEKGKAQPATQGLQKLMFGLSEGIQNSAPNTEIANAPEQTDAKDASSTVSEAKPDDTASALPGVSATLTPAPPVAVTTSMEDDDDSFAAEWWLWTLIGVAAVSLGAGTAIYFSTPEPESTRIRAMLP